MIISCYGDSNTRYYLGDTQENGPAADSYPAKLQNLFDEAGIDAKVYNCGYPDMRAAFGIEHFDENVTDYKADVCILGYGTNDIAQPDAPLAPYIDEFEQLIKLCKAQNIKTAALLIPWFSKDYRDPGGYARIPVWNEALKELCARYDVHTFDVFTPFSKDPDLYFNEKVTPKRHYSAAATAEIAKMVFEWLKK